ASYTLPSDDALYSLAASSPEHAWAIDYGRGRVWKLSGGTTAGPWLLGETIAAALALPDGRLIVNTRDHPTAAFALVGDGGTIVRRFGARRPSLITALSKIDNSWVLAHLGRGRFVAVHGYEPLLRVYRADGTMESEAVLKSDTVDRLRTRQSELASKLMAHADTCCVEAEHVRFANEVESRGGRSFAVRFGAANVLEEFDLRGSLIATHALPAAREDDPLFAGLVFTNEGIVAGRDGGIVLYPRQSGADRIAGRALLADGAPAAGAKIAIRLSAGGYAVVHTSADGTFQISGLAPAAAARVSASLENHLPEEREGTLAEIVQQPFRLRPVPAQCVTVLDRDTNRPVADFSLTLLRRRTASAAASYESSAPKHISDASGQGCVTASWPPPWRVRIEAERYADYEQPLESAAPVEVRLAPEARLTLTVRSGDAPVEGATVTLEPADQPEQTFRILAADDRQSTDREGTARFTGLGEGSVRVTVQHPDYLPSRKTVEVTAGDNEYAATLSKGARGVVEVVSTSSQPVADAEIQLDPEGHLLADAIRCTTGSDGRCTLEPLPPGRFSIVAAAPGFARSRRPFDVRPESDSVAVRMELRRAVTLDGRVVGLERYPGADLSVSVSPLGSPVQRIPIAADGTFKVNEVPSGTMSVAVDDRRSAILYERVDVPDVPQYTLTLQLPEPLLVRGRITRDGRGCGSCSLLFTRAGAESARASAKATVAPDGRYEARLPTRGLYTATAEHAQTQARAAETVAVSGDLQRDFELGGATLTVRVLDSERKPVARAAVAVTNAGVAVGEATTNEEGVAHFSAIPRGTYAVVASGREASASRTTTISVQPVELELVLPPRQVVTLRIVGATTGLPVPSIDARVISGARRAVHPRIVPDERGVFTIPLFDPAPATVVLQAPGYAVKTLPNATARAGEQVVSLQPRKTFAVEVAARLRPCSFALLDLSGTPLALAFHSDPGPTPLVVHEATFNWTEPGTYVARLETCDGRRHEQPLSLVPGPATPVVRFE
ncbi:MAG TPA: carboxypeptidase-like regulatory domain-containing protein, partial [Thermoanaerobaculia bacterium]|nr:carboxypeptidase-like regulatory domain-containing protein [Thermoanaerobaculia bacterium]